MTQPIPVSPMGDWECPCGEEPPATQTVNALREPCCRFCGRKQKDEYRRRAGSGHIGRDGQAS